MHSWEEMNDSPFVLVSKEKRLRELEHENVLQQKILCCSLKNKGVKHVPLSNMVSQSVVESRECTEPTGMKKSGY